MGDDRDGREKGTICSTVLQGGERSVVYGRRCHSSL